MSSTKPQEPKRITCEWACRRNPKCSIPKCIQGRVKKKTTDYSFGQTVCSIRTFKRFHTQCIEENLLRNVSDGYKEIFSNNCEKTTIDRIVDKYQKLKDPQLFDYYIAGEYGRLKSN